MADKSRCRKLELINLTALLLTFILPFAVGVDQLTAEIHQRVEFAQPEIYGNIYLRPLETSSRIELGATLCAVCRRVSDA